MTTSVRPRGGNAVGHPPPRPIVIDYSCSGLTVAFGGQTVIAAPGVYFDGERLLSGAQAGRLWAANPEGGIADPAGMIDAPTVELSGTAVPVFAALVSSLRHAFEVAAGLSPAPDAHAPVVLLVPTTWGTPRRQLLRQAGYEAWEAERGLASRRAAAGLGGARADVVVEPIGVWALRALGSRPQSLDIVVEIGRTVAMLTAFYMDDSGSPQAIAGDIVCGAGTECLRIDLAAALSRLQEGIGELQRRLARAEVSQSLWSPPDVLIHGVGTVPQRVVAELCKRGTVAFPLWPGEAAAVAAEGRPRLSPMARREAAGHQPEVAAGPPPVPRPIPFAVGPPPGDGGADHPKAGGWRPGRSTGPTDGGGRWCRWRAVGAAALVVAVGLTAAGWIVTRQGAPGSAGPVAEIGRFSFAIPPEWVVTISREAPEQVYATVMAPDDVALVWYARDSQANGAVADIAATEHYQRELEDRAAQAPGLSPGQQWRTAAGTVVISHTQFRQTEAPVDWNVVYRGGRQFSLGCLREESAHTMSQACIEAVESLNFE